VKLSLFTVFHQMLKGENSVYKIFIYHAIEFLQLLSFCFDDSVKHPSSPEQI